MARTMMHTGLFRLRRPRGIPLFTVFGIRIFVDYSWFLIAALITGTLTVGFFPSMLPDLTLRQYLLLGIITAFFFFASVLVHELSHSVVAVLSGIPVRRITLFLFGGVAEITKEPPDPRTELRIALAGPATSALLAALFWTAWLVLGAQQMRSGLRLAVYFLALANTSLLAFNLLPGLPLDGGRVLRAILWRTTRSLRRATYIASLSGKGLAALLVLGGFVLIALGTFSQAHPRDYIVPGLWFIFIALFLRQAADSSYRQVVLRETLVGVRMRDVMTAEVVTVPPWITLVQLVDEYFLHHHFICYPVVEGGRPVGLITIRDVKHVPREEWGSMSVAEAMTPIERAASLRPEDDVATAVRRMSATGLGRLPVLDDGRLVGIVTRRDIMSHLRIRSDLST